MHDSTWTPPVALSPEEESIASRLKRTGKLFLFLRTHRHELFDESFQAELAGMYSTGPYAAPPKPPALLAMVTLLQAYQKTSDAVAVENSVMDRRWQFVLDGLGTEAPLFSQGVLVSFRQRLIDHDMDRRLLERTVELARRTGGFGHKVLRVALDSAPLWGAGRVEDTFNLVGHALESVVECAAAVAGMEAVQVRRQAGTELLGKSSIKAALDIDWDDKLAQQEALERLLADVAAVRAWVTEHLPAEKRTRPLQDALAVLAQVIEQDIEPDPSGGGCRIRRGTAKNRRISITDGEMRHGRKSKSRVINGYKRHVATDLDSGLILAATVRPANEREYFAEKEIRPDVERQGVVRELHIDRGYLAGTWAKDLHQDGRTVLSKPWTTSGPRYSKSDFDFDFEAKQVTCPAGQVAPITRTCPEQPSRASFRTRICKSCSHKTRCVSERSKSGRSLTLHEVEPLLQDLRRAGKTTAGRQRLRERVAVEHSLAHVCNRQGRRARYRGVRKNVFDVRRTAAVVNLHQILLKAA